MKRLGIAVAALATLALVASDAWSAHGGSRGGGRGGFAAAGASSRAAFGMRRATPLPPGFAHPAHHHHGAAVIFIGAPFVYWSWPYGYYYAPPPYYYGPDYVATEVLPPVYVEKFDGAPTPQTPGEIYCPGSGAFYPDVPECPTGWQRIFRELDDEERWDAG
jgi:hypothetical protein